MRNAMLAFLAVFHVACGSTDSEPDFSPGDAGSADATDSSPTTLPDAGGDAQTPDAKVTPPLPSYEVAAITLLTENGGRVDWSPSGDRIAYDAPDADNVYAVYTMKPDGTDPVCVSCGVVGLPGRTVGNPAWHPSGKYLVVQAEKAVHSGPAFVTNPGRGLHSDLFLIDVAGKVAFALTNLPDGPGSGVLHPHFSDDGQYLSWTEMTEQGNPLDPQKTAGYWVLKVARIEIEPDGAALTDVKEFAPGGGSFHENHGFDAAGERLYFSSNYQEPLWSSDVHVLTLSSGSAVALTNEGYNEHVSARAGVDKLLFMTNLEVSVGKGSEWWLMNADGSDKQKLTYLNEPDHPHTQPGTSVCADSSWRPDGRSFVGLVLDGPLSNEAGRILRVDFAD